MDHLVPVLCELKSIQEAVGNIVSHAWGRHKKGDDRPWKLAYDLIFNQNVSSRAFNLMSENGIDYSDYYDPDTSYQDDVLAFNSFISSKVDYLDLMINGDDGIDHSGEDIKTESRFNF